MISKNYFQPLRQSIYWPIALGLFLSLFFCINSIWMLALMLVVPMIWLSFSKRSMATLFIVFLYLGWGWEIVPATLKYYGATSFLLACAAWIASAVLPMFPWLICFPAENAKPWVVAACVLLVFLLLTVPPLGVLTWGNPFNAAGLFFPSLRWLGLILFCILCVCCACLTRVTYLRFPLTVLVLGLLLLSLICNLFFAKTPLPNAWIAINTSAKGNSESYLINLINQQAKRHQQVVILPENTINAWAAWNTPMWQNERKYLANHHVVVVGGAFFSPYILEEPHSFIETHGEGMMLMDAGKLVFYDDRQPLPIMSWKPWSVDNVTVHWWDSGAFEVAQKKLGIFVCFEDFLPWLYLMTMLEKPDILISVANHWWNMPTAIHKQLFIFQAWARLMGVPTLVAENL